MHPINSLAGDDDAQVVRPVQIGARSRGNWYIKLDWTCVLSFGAECCMF